MVGGTEQCRETRATVEARDAPPVDRSGPGNESRGLTVTEEGVVLEARGTVDHLAKLPGVASRAMSTPAIGTPSGGTPSGTRSLIGVDVGGSGIKGAHVDLSTGNATGRIRIETPNPSTPEAVADVVATLVDQLGDPGPIGCTLPSVVVGGTVRTAAHIDESWIGTHAAAVIGKATGRHCVVLNDADAAGVAEARFGAARGRRGVVILVTVGTGVGTALLNDGVLVANSELGHIEVDGKLADVWASDATRASKQLSWDKWADRFNTYLTQLHRILWPELIVIGGGVVKHADKYIDRISPGCEVRIAELGNLAGIVGTALMADAAGIGASEVAGAS
jgi:polyphosphate glucokinase